MSGADPLPTAPGRSPLAEAAARIRADVKAAVAAGELPPYPDGVKFRVRSERASLMTAINIYVVNVPRSWAYDCSPGAINRMSAANLLLREALRTIAERHYTADGSGSFIDVQVRLQGEDD